MVILNPYVCWLYQIYMKLNKKKIYSYFLRGVIISIIVLTRNSCWGQSPATVPDIANKVMPQSWYNTQAVVWKEASNKTPEDPKTWLNYYLATKYHFLSKEQFISNEASNVLKAIESASFPHIGNTPTYNYLSFLNKNNDKNSLNLLNSYFQSHTLKQELYDDYIAFYEISGNTLKKKEYCNKLHSSGYYGKLTMAYNYNVLMSLEKNAFLVVNGHNDTYPLWIWQQTKDIRTDVRVLNLDLLRNKSYRDRIFRENNIPPYNGTYSINLIAMHIASFVNAPLYFGLSCPRQLVSKNHSDLTLTGLALKWSENNYEGLSSAAENWERRFDKKLLTQTNYKSGAITNNYLILFIDLFHYYKSLEKQKEADELLAYVKRLAENHPQKKFIMSQLRH